MRPLGPNVAILTIFYLCYAVILEFIVLNRSEVKFVFHWVLRKTFFPKKFLDQINAGGVGLDGLFVFWLVLSHFATYFYVIKTS